MHRTHKCFNGKNPLSFLIALFNTVHHYEWRSVVTSISASRIESEPIASFTVSRTRPVEWLDHLDAASGEESSEIDEQVRASRFTVPLLVAMTDCGSQGVPRRPLPPLRNKVAPSDSLLRTLFPLRCGKHSQHLYMMLTLRAASSYKQLRCDGVDGLG